MKLKSTDLHIIKFARVFCEECHTAMLSECAIDTFAPHIGGAPLSFLAHDQMTLADTTCPNCKAVYTFKPLMDGDYQVFRIR
jgi:hypothetical protein